MARKKVVQEEVTIKIRRWGNTTAPNNWHVEELPRVLSLIEDGYLSGEIVRDDSDGGWWELSSDES